MISLLKCVSLILYYSFWFCELDFGMSHTPLCNLRWVSKWLNNTNLKYFLYVLIVLNLVFGKTSHFARLDYLFIIILNIWHVSLKLLSILSLWGDFKKLADGINDITTTILSFLNGSPNNSCYYMYVPTTSIYPYISCFSSHCVCSWMLSSLTSVKRDTVYSTLHQLRCWWSEINVWIYMKLLSGLSVLIGLLLGLIYRKWGRTTLHADICYWNALPTVVKRHYMSHSSLILPDFKCLITQAAVHDNDLLKQARCEPQLVFKV